MVSRAYYFGLDLIRFGSALTVASFHLLFWSWAGVLPTIDQTNHLFEGAATFRWAAALTWFGWVGIQIFFLISGFVIANSAAGASPIEFLIGRVLRLYPAAWVCATGTLAALVFIAGDPFSVLVGPYVRSLFLIPRARWIDGVYWTLAVEITFYTFVFIILLVKRMSLIHLVWALTLLSSIFNAFYLSRFLSGTPLPYSLLDLYPLVSVFLLLPHGCLFAAGIWLWFAANEQMTAVRWVGFAIALLASGAQVYTQSIQFLWSVPAASAQSPFVPLAVFLFATLMIVIFTQAGNLFSVGTARAKLFLRYLGLVTYPFYLIHNLVGAGISRLLIEAGLNSLLAVCLTLGGLLYVCWLFCWILEPTIRNLLRLGLIYFERTIVRPRRAFAFLFMK